MRRRSAVGLSAAAIGLAVVSLASDAVAQAPAPDTRRVVVVRRHVPRVTIYPAYPSYPSDRYYRRCDFALAVEHRPSGDVITPQQHCVWALR